MNLEIWRFSNNYEWNSYKLYFTKFIFQVKHNNFKVHV